MGKRYNYHDGPIDWPFDFLGAKKIAGKGQWDLAILELANLSD